MKSIKYSVLLLLVMSAFSVNAQDSIKIKVMTYNLRFGELATASQLAEQIKLLNPDFVALQEVDVNTSRAMAPHQNGVNMISEIAGEANMFSLYGKTINLNKGYYGIAILSKYPYTKVNKAYLPNPQNVEPRVLLEGTFEIGKGDTIVFATTHLDVKSESTRILQAEFIDNYFKNTPYPIIIGGDFNATPDSKVIQEVMNENWESVTDLSPTFPSSVPKKKIDYIFVTPKSKWKLIKTTVIQSPLSDHLPIVTELEYIKE